MSTRMFLRSRYALPCETEFELYKHLGVFTTEIRLLSSMQIKRYVRADFSSMREASLSTAYGSLSFDNN
ncbi:hypothetical protein QR680_006141 [Steinernema hermaphroditum]|uniref:Uncharacterized protein n=1 Tax=Steinernema hermaphroditum TaxID=289476 RepID=A0AA39LWM3_9BILA|nr:hypothetical protein QR680_006141 [Steinernema hermaphroditum]